MVDGDDGRARTAADREEKRAKIAVTAPSSLDTLPQIPPRGVLWFVGIGRNQIEPFMFDSVIVHVERLCFSSVGLALSPWVRDYCSR